MQGLRNFECSFESFASVVLASEGGAQSAENVGGCVGSGSLLDAWDVPCLCLLCYLLWVCVDNGVRVDSVSFGNRSMRCQTLTDRGVSKCMQICGRSHAYRRIAQSASALRP